MKSSRTVQLPQMAWYGDTPIDIDFPDSWDVTVCRAGGQSAPALDDAGIRSAFANPIGTKTIRELARGKKEVVILFDDLTRATPVHAMLPYVLEELAQAGITDEHIRLIAAVGAHGAMNGLCIRKKLGEEAMERFLIYNHNPYEFCTPLGSTSRGVPVVVNSEVMRCDLKIGIGSIVPHPLAGFGGGAKIILPGVASAETISVNHNKLGSSPTVDVGKYEGNIARADMEETARMAGLDVKVDALLNLKREVTALYVGDFVEEHREAVKVAKTHYAADFVPDCDIVIANCYFKANEVTLAPRVSHPFLKSSGGDMVFIAITPEGQMTHYLGRTFGRNMGGRTWFERAMLPQNTRRLTIMSPYPDKVGADWTGPYDKVNRARTWTEVRSMLEKTYGKKAKVAVIPDATSQYFPGEPAARSETAL
ncbi:MAG: lactate racemase domain-containing protein [Dehalococcoidia bacterium]|nr:lactate racemase domain-containing protein [Dehalococcoidia bacterium]